MFSFINQTRIVSGSPVNSRPFFAYNSLLPDAADDDGDLQRWKDYCKEKEKEITKCVNGAIYYLNEAKEKERELEEETVDLLDWDDTGFEERLYDTKSVFYHYNNGCIIFGCWGDRPKADILKTLDPTFRG